ncbi:MAG TPA: hypothetical protein PLA03_13785 [Acidobacteriota bacterium]|nr:hypothetical protein [Acidobacteriota bacterium]HNT18723.1 hypothetical protein [Acidobacteriota bacterium]HQO21405.1 hypothetical protein [Acidobacteriota bacterium]
MSNRNYICFKCRTTVRREDNAEREVKCPHCGANTENIGYKIPIPPKVKIKVWQNLEEQLKNESLSATANEKKFKAKRMHDIEKELEKLEALPENEGRKALIKKLKQELAQNRGANLDRMQGDMKHE